jgi:hypothetical protein
MVATGTFITVKKSHKEFLGRIVSSECTGNRFKLNLSKPSPSTTLKGRARFQAEVVQTEDVLFFCLQKPFKLVFVLCLEDFNDPSSLLGDKSSIVFVCKRREDREEIRLFHSFPDSYPSYCVEERSYAKEVFSDLCLIADHLSQAMNSSRESQGTVACARAYTRILKRT